MAENINTSRVTTLGGMQGGGGDGRILPGSTTPTVEAPKVAVSPQNGIANQKCATPNSQKETSSGLCFKDREERVRQLREKQQHERNRKLEELKEQAAAAQRFREQQEQLRRQRIEEMRQKDNERRTQVEERRRLIEQAERERREASIRRNVSETAKCNNSPLQDKDQRAELKRRQERSNAVFAFGSSTPRMLDPKESPSSTNVFGSRRATSTTNVNVVDGTPDAVRRPTEATDSDLSRKRATSAHSLNRKPDELRMSSSMYEVFHWDDDNNYPSKSSPAGEDLMSRSFTTSTAARRRTDLFPVLPSARDSSKTKHRSPGRTVSMSRLDQMSRAKSSRPSVLSPLHESPARSHQRMKPARTMSKSMSHLGPQRPRPSPIGPTTDGSGVPVSQGSLDKRSSRSSLALGPPRLTRSEILRQNKIKGVSSEALVAKTTKKSGVSGTTTPGSPSRPTSALSQGSGNVIMRSKATPRKQRPLSIAGTVVSSADKPKASNGRESRPIERKSSTGSTSSLKQVRAKSVDNKNPKTPSKAASTPKRTPAQVKAESAARKEKNKPKSKPTPKATPIASPAMESKPLPSVEPKTEAPAEMTTIAPPVQEILEATPQPIEQSDKVIETTTESEIVTESVTESIVTNVDTVEVSSKTVEGVSSKTVEEVASKTIEEVSSKTVEEDSSKTVEEDSEESLGQKSSDKPVTGYATEEDYKQALAEKRRQAREAKEREMELERQRQLEAEEAERREEEEYLRLVEEQRKAEEERLQKAIEEAAKQREVEIKQKEEEEKQRLETERLEKIKQAEHEEKMRKEEEERQARKSRVAAIMTRTRGKGTPKGDDGKSPDENRTLNESLSESFLSKMTGSMTDSMIVRAIESKEDTTPSIPESQSDGTSLSSQVSTVESTSQHSSVTVVSDHSIVSHDSSVFEAPAQETHINGKSEQGVDLLESVNGGVHNGSIQNGKTEESHQFDSFDPFTPAVTINKTENGGVQLDQFIDLSQTRVTNEDALNSNHPAPFIAFEDNINNKQHQESSNVPDLLL